MAVRLRRINQHLYSYCRDEKITFTRGWSHKKNDSRHVEQKNWSLVRARRRRDARWGTTAVSYRYSSHAAYLCLDLLTPYPRGCMAASVTTPTFSNPTCPKLRTLGEAALQDQAGSEGD